jgi:hypothetical protein
MKKILLIVALLFMISACATAQGTMVRGTEIKVLYGQDYVRQALGNPDETTSDSWTYLSRQPGEPDTIIYWGAGGVTRVVQSEPK